MTNDMAGAQPRIKLLEVGCGMAADPPSSWERAHSSGDDG